MASPKTLYLLREIRSEMATKGKLAEVKADLSSEIKSLCADVAADLHNLDARIDGTRKKDISAR